MRRATLEVVVLSLLAAVPTAAGYVLGPLSRALGAVASSTGVPFAPRLGFLPLVTVTVLARAYLGRGAAVKEGLLLAVTGALLHPRDLTLRFARNVLLGVGVELSLLGAKRLNAALCVLAGLAGGLLSYAPYLLFTPLSPGSALAAYAALVLSAANWLLTCALGAYVAALALKRVPRLPLSSK